MELRDQSNTPIPGFTISDADTITGDSVAKNLTWNGSRDLSSLIGQDVKLHFDMVDIKLYAFQFVPILVGDVNNDDLVNCDDIDLLRNAVLVLRERCLECPSLGHHANALFTWNAGFGVTERDVSADITIVGIAE